MALDELYVTVERLMCKYGTTVDLLHNEPDTTANKWDNAVKQTKSSFLMVRQPSPKYSREGSRLADKGDFIQSTYIGYCYYDGDIQIGDVIIEDGEMFTVATATPYTLKGRIQLYKMELV